MVIINFILIGILTYIYYIEFGTDAAIITVVGLTTLITVGAILPWWVSLILSTWLAIIARCSGNKPKATIADKS